MNGNRHQRRVHDSIARKSTSNVSPALLQKQLASQQLELQQLRNVLFSLVKEQGRVKFKKETLEGLTEADGIDVTLDEFTKTYVITYVRHDTKESA